MSKRSKGVWAFIAVLAVLIALGAGLAALVYSSVSNGVLRKESIPELVILGGVIALLLIFIGAGVLFKAFDIGDGTQAFGLPDGSIRAVVATMAMLLFGVVPLFLFTSLSEGKAIERAEGLTADKALSFEKELKDKYLSTDPILPTPIPPGDKQQYTVLYRNLPPDAAIDFEKQFFTTLATLVAAMSSFFFGSAVASSAAKAGANTAMSGAVSNINPSLKGVTPGSSPVPNASLSPILTGSGLNQITKVDLIQGNHVISATGVTSSPDTVRCAFDIASGTPSGTWAIEVTSSDNPPKTARLDNAITLS